MCIRDRSFFAGLVFAFARHMTSLSAVIFLTTAQWPILTVWILSEVEQGGMSASWCVERE